MNKKQRNKLLKQRYKLFYDKYYLPIFSELFINWHTIKSLSRFHAKNEKTTTNPLISNLINILKKLKYLDSKKIKPPPKNRKLRNGKFKPYQWSRKELHYRLNFNPFIEWLEKEMIKKELPQKKGYIKMWKEAFETIDSSGWINYQKHINLRKDIKISIGGIKNNFFWNLLVTLQWAGLYPQIEKPKLKERIFWGIIDSLHSKLQFKVLNRFYIPKQMNKTILEKHAEDNINRILTKP